MPTGPTGKALLNEDEFFKYVAAGQTYNISGGITSTAHISGQPSYAATTHSVSDILQGSLYNFNPQDELLVINRALTNSLTNLYGSEGGIHGLSSFTKTIPTLTNAPRVDGGYGGSFGGAIPSGLPEEGAVTAAFAAMRAGFQGEDLLRAVMIAGRESGWRNVKSKVSADYGMWQINSINLKSMNTIGVTAMEQLLDPFKNAEGAHLLYKQSGFNPWRASGNSSRADVQRATGGKGFDPNGDPMWNTSQFEAEARAAIEQAMQLASTVGFDGAISSSGTQIVNTLEEFQYAGNKIANHPNMKMNMDTVLKSGFQTQTSNPIQYISAWFPEANRGFLVPSLLNYLWYILEGGFSLGQYLGSYVHRNRIGGSSSLSNHAHGGAIDIGALGGPGADPVSSSNPRWRSYNDQLFQYLSTLSRDTKPQEAASSFEYNYGWYRVYKDPNPNHIHLGFGREQVGQLIPALKPGGNSGANGFRLVR